MTIRDLDTSSNIDIERSSIVCPYCGTKMIPNYLGSAFKDRDHYHVLVRCQEPKCSKVFLTSYNTINRTYSTRQYIAVVEQKYDDSINKLSPSFVNIYN